LEFFDIDVKAVKEKKAVSTPPKKQKKAEPTNERDKVTRAAAIRLNCVECMGYQKNLVNSCENEGCALWPFRKGVGQEHTDRPLNGSR
jgi:hypothetical protein